jgi:hypothetical protein
MKIITFFEKISNVSKLLPELMKTFLESSFFKGAVVLLFLIISFLLGRLSSLLDETTTFTLEEGLPEFVSSDELQKVQNFDFVNAYKNTSTSTIVASSKGKKYYFIWCKSAGNIKEANRIYFKTEKEAQETGRTLASGCK